MWIVLLGCLTLADAPKKAEPDAQELKNLAGQWLITEQEHGGKKTPAKVLLDLAVEVAGAKMTTRERNDVKEASTIVVLDAKAKPAAIDLKITTGADVDKVVKGIYKLKGDDLTICVAEPGKDRPGAFAAREGTGHTLLVFKRVKKK
jgi:uncharacterized protein (TIGR03067 family)